MNYCIFIYFLIKIKIKLINSHLIVDEQPIQSTEAADYENEDNHYYVPGSSSGSYEDDIDTYNEIDDTSSANGFEYNLKLLYRSIICVSLFTILLQ